MEEVKRKVLLDLFAAPAVLLPVVAGATSLLLSFAMGGQAGLNLIGLGGMLGGAGMLATRLIYKLEDLTEQAYEHLQQQQRKQQEKRLDDLYAKLQQDNDPRTHECLSELRRLYEGFQENQKEANLTAANYEIHSKVDELFQACTKQLERSYELWETAENMSGGPRQRVLAQREQVIGEVLGTIEHIGGAIERFHTFTLHRDRADLARLRDELEESMRIARRTEEQLASLGETKTYTESEFE